MEYPGSKFSRPYRVAFLILTIAAFFVILPFVLLYSEGFSLNLSNGWLREAGGLSIDEIKPTSAEVFLNGIKINGTLPIRLKNITPRQYDLKISAKGYYDFEKTISVKNKETLYIKQFNLLKKNTPKLTNKGSYQNLSVSTDGRFVIFTETNGATITVWENDTNKFANTPIYYLPKTNKYSLTWAPHESAAIIQEESATRTMAYAYEPLKNNLTDLTKLVSSPIDKLVWNDSADAELYISTKNNLYFYAVKTEQLINVTKINFNDWTLGNTKLITLNAVSATGTNNVDYSITKDALGFSKNVTLPDLSSQKSETNNWSLLSADTNTVILINQNKQNLYVNNGSTNFKLNLSRTNHSLFNDWWLLWNDSEVWAMISGQSPYLLTRSGDTIKNVLILDKYNTTAVVWDKKISYTYPYYLVTNDLISGTILETAVDTNKQIIYINGTLNGVTGIWALSY